MKIRKNPLVSVIFPTTRIDKEFYLAINSIYIQTYENWEILLILDAPKLHYNPPNRYKKKIKIFNNRKNFGISHCLNIGINESKGEFIARMDSDDFSFINRFEKQVKYLINNDSIDLIGSSVILFEDEHKILGKKKCYGNHLDLTKLFWKEIPIPHPTWMVRKNFFNNNLYSEVCYRGQDQEILIRSMKNNIFYCFNESLLGYRFNKKSIKSRSLGRYRVYLSIRNNINLFERMKFIQHHFLAFLRDWLSNLLNLHTNSLLIGKISLENNKERLDFNNTLEEIDKCQTKQF